MGAAPTLLLGALCHVLLLISAHAAGNASSLLGCKGAELLTGDLCTPSIEAQGLLVNRAHEEGERGFLCTLHSNSLLYAAQAPMNSRWQNSAQG